MLQCGLGKWNDPARQAATGSASFRVLRLHPECLLFAVQLTEVCFWPIGAPTFVYEMVHNLGEMR